MASLSAVVDYCRERLDSASFEDYCPNGLQVEAGETVSRLVSGVTASQGLIDAAVERGADALLVHHGFFWKGEAQPLTGLKGRRIRTLFTRGVSLMAFHLPLDAHPELGNNRQLGVRLGLDHGRPVAEGDMVWGAELAESESVDVLVARLAQAVERQPLHIEGGPAKVRRVAWCTGAAQGYIERAAALGYDLFVSGEISEQTVHLARELGIHYLAAGHHATERYGVQALGEELAREFGIRHEFVEIANPV